MPDDRGYELTIRQEPKQVCICSGVGADHYLVDPPPIIQLHTIGTHTRHLPSSANSDADDTDPNYTHNCLQDPYYFMFASLAKLDNDTELYWLKDGKTRCMTGSVVSSLYQLKNIQNRTEDADLFVFPFLSVHADQGSYRLKFSLFRVVGDTVHHCKSIYSAAFYVYTAKKFPGMEESTSLSCSLADQGKVRIRKDIRVRKRPIAALTPPFDCGQLNPNKSRKLDQDQNEDDIHPQQPLSSQLGPASTAPGSAIVKRARQGTLTSPLHLVSGPASVTSSDGLSAHTPVSANNLGSSIALPGLPAWPTSSALDPMLGVASATPGGIELSAAATLPHAHAHTHTHAHAAMGGGVGVSVGGQLISAASEPSSVGSGSAAAGTVARRTQGLSASASTYLVTPSNVGGMYDRLNYEYELSSLRGTTSSYDPQRQLGGGTGAGYEGGSGASGRGGYDAGGARNGYESGAGSRRTGFEHAQPHPRGLYDPQGGYDSSQVPAPSRAAYDAHPDTQAHPEVHGHPSHTSFSGSYEGQPYQDGQPQQHHHSGYAHSQQTSASYAHASSTGSHPPHPSASHHPQQRQYLSLTRSQCPLSAYPGSYARCDVSTNQSVNPSASPNGPGSGGYYDNPSTSSSSHQHSQSYYTGGSDRAPSPPTQVAQAPPLTHVESYASPGSAGSTYEYAGQGQGHGSSSSTEYYNQQGHGHAHGHGHPGRAVSLGPNARYAVSLYESGALPTSASGWGHNRGGHVHGLGQQEMIHLAPLRHASGGGGSAGSPSSPSSPALPSVFGGGYPVIQLSRAPFEHDARGVPGKKSVLSIGSIISDGA